jgi:hypothetical protein
MAVARETAKQSQEILDTNHQVAAGMSTYKRRGVCTRSWCHQTAAYPAATRNIVIKVTARLKTISVDVELKDKKEDTEARQETCHSINESCFNIQLTYNIQKA